VLPTLVPASLSVLLLFEPRVASDNLEKRRRNILSVRTLAERT
jgi:hypothetical protein